MLAAASDVIQQAGLSIHPERQAGPHAHCILPDPTNRFAIAVDLGLDKLIIYQMDLENGKLHKQAEVDVQAGAGPRHLTFHPNGQFAYLINELNSTLIGYGYSSESGTFQELQAVPACRRTSRARTCARTFTSLRTENISMRSTVDMTVLSVFLSIKTRVN